MRPAFSQKCSLVALASGLNAMQSALQQFAEELILLDRLEYLLESGKVGQATVKRVIPCEVTPRGCVIFAAKFKQAAEKILNFIYLLLKFVLNDCFV